MLIPQQRSRRRSPLILAIALIALVGAASSAYVYLKVDEAGRHAIQNRATTVAETVDGEALHALSGSEVDTESAVYASLKSVLGRVASVNDDIEFLYLMGERADGTLFFYVDSEPADSEDYSPPGQVYDEATPAMQALFKDGAARTEGPDQDRWGVWISAYAPVRDASGNVVALLGVDLPAQRFLTDLYIYSALPSLVALFLILIFYASMHARRRELEFLEEKAEFLAIASHEIRTPLTGMRFALENLLAPAAEPLPASAKQLLTLMHETSVRLIARINNLLDIAKLEHAPDAFTRETIDVPSFIKEVIASLALSADARKVTLVTSPSVASAGTLSADRQLLYHALFNLIANAIKYTKEGTTVTIGYERDGSMHAFSVADEGDGVSPEEQEKIFSGYHRAEGAASSVTGTGLGLYLTKKAAQMHGGEVSVDSTPGRGATFLLRIPD